MLCAQIGNAGVQYNDPQENPVPEQKAGSNFPGEGVRLPLSSCACPLGILQTFESFQHPLSILPDQRKGTFIEAFLQVLLTMSLP